MENRGQIYEIIADNIRKERRRLGMTQAELAERADISLDTIKSVENGRRAMSLDTYLNIVYVETPFRDTNWQLVRVKCSKKAFLWIYEKDGYVNLNVKADKEWRDYWRSAFKSVIPGWHQNKENWNTIILDGSVPDDAIKTMIKESYELVTDNPTKRIYEAVKKIPKGCVATYGQIAELAGNKGMARAVGNALHRNPDPDNIPCYRVVNSKGELSGAFAFGGAGQQEQLLKADGIEVVNGKVDLKVYSMKF